VIVKPAGTRAGPSTRVISATFAPLPPSSSRISREPALKSYTQVVEVAIDMRRFIPHARGLPQRFGGRPRMSIGGPHRQRRRDRRG
jgi:hypothetical protein